MVMFCGIRLDEKVKTIESSSSKFVVLSQDKIKDIIQLGDKF